ncbi:MAG: hypothetical protein AVDCRST_MAG10-2836, partial [uncultured Acidimicrobiales bacterium]
DPRQQLSRGPHVPGGAGRFRDTGASGAGVEPAAAGGARSHTTGRSGRRRQPRPQGRGADPHPDRRGPRPELAARHAGAGLEGEPQAGGQGVQRGPRHAHCCGHGLLLVPGDLPRPARRGRHAGPVQRQQRFRDEAHSAHHVGASRCQRHPDGPHHQQRADRWLCAGRSFRSGRGSVECVVGRGRHADRPRRGLRREGRPQVHREAPRGLRAAACRSGARRRRHRLHRLRCPAGERAARQPSVRLGVRGALDRHPLGRRTDRPGRALRQHLLPGSQPRHAQVGVGEPRRDPGRGHLARRLSGLLDLCEELQHVRRNVRNHLRRHRAPAVAVPHRPGRDPGWRAERRARAPERGPQGAGSVGGGV